MKILNRPLIECPLFLYYVLLFIAPFLSLFYTGYPGHSFVFGLASILFTTEHSATNSNCAQIHLKYYSIQGQRRFHWGSQCRYILVQQGNLLWGIVNWSDIACKYLLFFFGKNTIQKKTCHLKPIVLLRREYEKLNLTAISSYDFPVNIP